MHLLGRPRSRQTRLQMVGRLAVLLVALSGLFAMHGLADHGTAATGAMPGMSAAVAAVDMPMSAHPESHHAPAADTQSLPTPNRKHHDMGAMGACVAVMVAALFIALVGLLLLRLPLPWLRPHRVQHRIRALARAPAPPDLHRLCIQRC